MLNLNGYEKELFVKYEDKKRVFVLIVDKTITELLDQKENFENVLKVLGYGELKDITKDQWKYLLTEENKKSNRLRCYKDVSKMQHYSVEACSKCLIQELTEINNKKPPKYILFYTKIYES